MTLKEILWGGGGAVVILMTILQISPIKIDPWSALAKAIGKAITKEALEKLDEVEKKVTDLQEQVSEESAVNSRARILRFGDEVLHGERHSKEHFDQTLRDIDTYERYCEEHKNFENNVTVLTSKRIKEIYMDRLEKGDFL